ncbi:MAG TPA: type II CAAX endopeptidase family protein [Panacibacter sp.]|nr:type II CAAX endopeptidase family protein [Panacibacter sp.]
MLMHENTGELYLCEECESRVENYQRFCHHCGAYLGSNAEQISIFNNSRLQNAFFFYTIYLFICLTVKYTSWFSSYDRLFWIEILLAVITVFFTRANWQSLKPVLRFNNLKWYILLAAVSAAIIFSSVVNILINQINISIFRTRYSMFDGYRLYEFPMLVMLYSVALMPALFEELAFRGILYNYLNSFLSEKMVVMVTGFIFAAIHLNFFSLVWLIPFGILIGTLRRKYNTIWYGVVFHFTFNITACLFDLYRQGELW